MTDTANEPPRPWAPTDPLRLPASLCAAVGWVAEAEGTSVAQLVALALAEKVVALAAEQEVADRIRGSVASLPRTPRTRRRRSPATMAPPRRARERG